MKYSVRKTPKGWCADARINGRRRQLYAPTKAEAEQRIRAEIRAAEAQGPGLMPEEFTLAQALRLSQEVRWKGSDWGRTAAIYGRQALAWFGRSRPLSEIRAPELEGWRQELLSQGNSPATVNKKMAVIRAMLADAALHGRIEAIPAMPRQLKVANLRDRILDPLEERAIVQWFVTTGQEEAADLIVFLVETGMRWGEAAGLTGKDVDLTRKVVALDKTKANRPRTIPLTARALEAVSPHVTGVPRYKVWSLEYQAFRHQLTRCLAALGIEGVTIHTLRHTCCSRLAQAGVPLHQLMAWSGHSSLSACSRYLHLNVERLDSCVRALEAVAGRAALGADSACLPRTGLWSDPHSIGSSYCPLCPQPSEVCGRPSARNGRLTPRGSRNLVNPADS